MSKEANTQLLARAHEAVEYCLNDPSGKDEQILRAIEDSDLDELERLVSEVEARMSQEDFYNTNILGANDVY